jgi:hypothetical protein
MLPKGHKQVAQPEIPLSFFKKNHILRALEAGEDPAAGCTRPLRTCKSCPKVVPHAAPTWRRAMFRHSSGPISGGESALSRKPIRSPRENRVTGGMRLPGMAAASMIEQPSMCAGMSALGPIRIPSIKTTLRAPGLVRLNEGASLNTNRALNPGIPIGTGTARMPNIPARPMAYALREVASI